MSLRPAPDVAWEVLADHTLLACHLASGTLLELSPPAGLLWSQLIAGDLDETLRRDFGVSAEDSVEEAASFCEALLDRGLLVESD